jgi:hypothetical protein
MIANGGAKTATSAGGGSSVRKPQTALDFLKSLPSRIRVVHVVIAMGVASVFLGYVSIAPPTDLPNWPLYRLNSRVWQTFEHWGQHVKPHHIRIMTMALQHIESRALYIMSYFEIPDIIQDSGEPLSCDEIKAKIDDKFGYEPVNLPFLCRVLHAAAHFDLLVEAGEHKYALTPLSEYLVTSHPRSLKEFVKLYSGDEALIVSTALSRSMFSGRSGFKETYREELADYLPKDEQLREIFSLGLSDFSRLHAPAIIADYPPFASCHHICDIGGGVGSFIHDLLQYYAFEVKGTNFDLPDMIKAGREYLGKQGAAGKIALVPGNFTEKLPKFECDCYILKDILQNWSDEDAALILQNLHSVMSPDHRLLVIETIMHTGSYSEERLKSLLDLTMMSFHPSHSRLRTEEELFFLLLQSGFSDPQTYPTRASYSIIETFPSSS